MLASQMEMDVSPPDADEVAVLAFEVFGLGMQGVDVILQFALLGERRVAMIAAFHFGSRGGRFLAFDRIDRIRGHFHDADATQRHRDVVLASQMEVDASPPEAGQTTFLAFVEILLDVHGVDVVF